MCSLLPTCTGALPCSLASLLLGSAEGPQSAQHSSFLIPVWQQLPGTSPATPGLTCPCLPVHVWGRRNLANPTPEKLLPGAGAGSALSRLRQAGLPTLPGQVEPQSRHVPTVRGISPLGFSTIESTDGVLGNRVRAVWGTSPHRWAGKEGRHKWDGCFSLAEGPTVSGKLTKAFNTTREGYQSSNHELKFRAWTKKLE